MVARLTFAGIVVAAIITAYILGHFDAKPKEQIAKKQVDNTSDTAAVITSPNDTKSYSYYMLDNGLQVLLISDPKTDKASAALDINIGSTSDPKTHLGLAHFLEHMLFLGTEPYPTAGEYQAFISKHGGSHNAFTAPEHTNYFFDIDPNYLKPALDRFAPFFISPLFSSEYVDRERNAVHSEYQARIKSDARRSYYAIKQVQNPEHPSSKFATGSLETLKDSEQQSLRDALITFYKTHYSANIMSLVVLGKEPLSELQSWVDPLFKAIPNHNASPLETDQPLFSAGQLPADMHIEPIKDNKQLSLSFPIPSMRAHSQQKPANYLAFYFGHEGEGSLLSYFKQKNWADSLSAGLSADNKDSAVISINIALSDEGFQHIDDITGAIFQYANLLHKQGVSEVRFNEQAKLLNMDFQFQEPMNPINYTSSLAGNLHRFDASNVVNGFYLMNNYDEKLIQGVLDYITPQNMLRVITAPGVETDKVEPWFGTPYKVTSINDSKTKAWIANNSVNDSALFLPKENPFIPEDFGLIKTDNTTTTPSIIKQTENIEVWHLSHTQFNVPKANFFVAMHSPEAQKSAQHYVMTQLFVALANDKLSAFSYPALVAGLNYKLSSSKRGFSLQISGYSDKQQTLLEEILSTVSTLKIQPKRFTVFKAELKRQLANTKKDTPYSQTISQLMKTLVNPSWQTDELLDALHPVTAEQLQTFSQKLLADTRLTVLGVGNISQEKTLQMAESSTEALLKGKTPTVKRSQVYKLAAGESVFLEVEIDHNDSALTLYYQGDEANFAMRARYGLLGHILASPYYEDLRTEQQLGYIVSAGPMPILDTPGLGFIVQSPVATPNKLIKVSEDFLQHYYKKLQQLSPDEFEKQKQGLISRLLEKPKNLAALSARLWGDLDKDQPIFDSRQQIADLVSEIALNEFITFYEQELLSANKSRLATVHRGMALSDEEKSGTDTLVAPQWKQLQSPDEFSKNRPLYPSN